MKRNIAWLTVAALVAGLVLLVPAAADAQEGKKKVDKKEKAAEVDEAEVDEAEPEAEAEPEPEPEPVEEDLDTESLFGADEELPKAKETEEKKDSVAADAKAPLQGTWNKSVVFTSEDGAFRFRPTGFVQPRFRMNIDPDADDTLAGSGFTLTRARLGFQATMFDIARIYLDSDFNSGAGRLVDFFADVDPFDGVAQLRMGYFRPWLGRQMLQGTTGLQHVEYARAWTDPALGINLGRDLGASIFGMVAGGVEYGVGVWNGEPGLFNLAARDLGGGMTAPANIDFQAGLRVAAHPLALAGVGGALPLGGETDLGYSDQPKLVIGGAFMYNKRHDQVIPVGGVDTLYYDNQIKFGAELGFQWKGISLQGEFFGMVTSVQDDADPLIKEEVALMNREPFGIGTYLQLGYFVLPRTLEVAARFDMVDEDMDLRGARFYPGVGTTWHIFGNNLKAQLMYRLNTQTGYGEGDDTLPADPNWIPTTHEIFLMLQASI